MQRGILKHYAHVLPRIFAERILWGPSDDTGLPADMSLLVSSGVGRLTIDMISGECERNGRRIEAPYIAGELKAWLARELQKQNDPPEDITAVLDVTFGAVKKQYPTSWAVQWSIDATATITSGGKTYSDTYSTP